MSTTVISNPRYVDHGHPELRAISIINIGLTSPRAFQAYKHTKEPQPLYFREILTNSLTDEQIKQFCQDFLALFSPKVHKQPVPCAIGASDSGKTSLFAPIFSIVPLHRIARVTKQKSFNKSMIDECTEIIFLDEAHVKLLDVDDWKILCQGGYTSHDSKWKKARGFHCQATMYLTCQTDMDFGGDEHNAAMDRRLNKYYFESLPRVVPEAHQWLRDNAMECIVWASQQVEQDQTATTLPAMVPQVGLTEDEIQNILNVPLTDNDQPSATDADSDHANLEDDDAEDISEDEEITELRQQISTTEPLTLRHRQLQFCDWSISLA
ncbi:hypothetical protein QZH41_006435 [Actinostola sp. cb2023]|nr:hypothetical protein QZH41_006435 [Actinostola sp. cb2023]